MPKDKMIPPNFYKNNLNFYPRSSERDLMGNELKEKSMNKRLGFLPNSLWKPNDSITKELKQIIGDTAQVRKTLNSSRSDRRSGVNGGKCSVFNPHLAQMILSAYCIPNANIFDAFGGGGTRGYISTRMGHKYTGIEIRGEEVDRIKQMFDKWGINFDILLGDSRNFKLDKKFDFSFTCPPYYDLEVYSKMDGDLSAYQTYEEYLNNLKKCIKTTYDCLKDNSLSIWVVGNFRNKKGELEHLNGDLIRIAKEVGFKLWDEIIWMGASNVALTRCGKFEVNRKCVRMHEYIIILKKYSEKQESKY
jgi:DNA modification methylase